MLYLRCKKSAHMVILAILLLVLSACNGDDGTTDGDEPTDGDRDGDVERDADGDREPDEDVADTPDGDTPLDGDLDADFDDDDDADADVEPDEDVDGDMEPDSEPDGDKDADDDGEPDADSDGDVDDDAEPDTESDGDGDQDADADEEWVDAHCEPCSADSCPAGHQCLPPLAAGLPARCARECPIGNECPGDTACEVYAPAVKWVCMPTVSEFCDNDDVAERNACGDIARIMDCADGNEYCEPNSASCELIGGGETSCNDTIDDDGDGNTDCADPDCTQDAVCCSYKYDISCGDYAYHNTNSQGEIGWQNYACSEIQYEDAELVYRFVAPYDGRAIFNLSSSDADIDLLLLKGCGPESCTQRAGSILDFEMTAGEYYYVVVDSTGYSAGFFELHLVCDDSPPDGDLDVEAEVELDAELDDEIDLGDGDLVDGDLDVDLEPEIELEPDVEPEVEIEESGLTACQTQTAIHCGDSVTLSASEYTHWNCGFSTGFDRTFYLEEDESCMVYATLNATDVDADLFIVDDCGGVDCAQSGDSSLYFALAAGIPATLVVDTSSHGVAYDFTLTLNCQCGLVDGDDDLDDEQDVEVEEESDSGGAICGGIPYEGCCVGYELYYCEYGEINDSDCAKQGLNCGWVNQANGYYDCGGSGGDPLSFYPLRCAAYSPPVMINEVLYDGSGLDDTTSVFIELYGTPGTSMNGCSLVAVNGANGETYTTISLNGRTIPGDGYFVIAHPNADSGLLSVADMTHSGADLENGPDSLRLLCDGAPADELGYGWQAPYYETQYGGDVSAGHSLARDPDHHDSDNNYADFTPCAVPTPGASNASCY